MDRVAETVIPEQKKIENTPKLETPLEFLTDILESSKAAKDRILVLSLALGEDHATGAILNGLRNAAIRGVDVNLHVDLLGQFQASLMRFQKPNQPNLVSDEFIASLKNSGVKLTTEGGFVERLQDVLPRGTQHAKLFIIDNVAWIGGINLTDEHFKNVDFMVKISDPDAVNSLAKTFNDIKKGRSFPNLSTRCNSHYEVLVDGGKPGDSVIYESALQMVKDSKKEVIFISQYPPGGRILEEMLKEKDKKEKDRRKFIIITSDKETLNNKLFLFKRNFNRYLEKVEGLDYIETIYMDRPVHAKAILTDREKAIIGSNNYFDKQGKLLGWHEINIKTNDEKVVAQIGEFLDTQIENGRKGQAPIKLI